MSTDATLDTTEAMRIAAFRAVIRSFLRTSERLAREHGLTPRRHLLLLMIKGAPDGSEQSTVTDLSARLQLAQSTVTELVALLLDPAHRAREPPLALRGEPQMRDAEVSLRALALDEAGPLRAAHELRRRLDELGDA